MRARLRWLFILAAAFSFLILITVASCSTFGSGASVEPTTNIGEEAGMSDVANANTNTDGSTTHDADGGASWVPCATHADDVAHFCEDFDFPGAIEARWDDTIIKTNNGTFGETDASLSPPRALAVHLPASAPSGRIQLQRSRPPLLDVTTKSHMRLSFWLHVISDPYPVVDASADGYMHVAVIEFEDPSCATSGASKQRSIELSFNTNRDLYMAGKGLRDQCPDFLSAKAPYGISHFTSTSDFRHITIDLTANKACPTEPAGGSLTLTVDDALPICLPVGNPFLRGSTFNLLLGLYGGGSQAYATTDLIYDNVTLDLD